MSKAKTASASTKATKRPVITPEQRIQRREVNKVMLNLGFKALPEIEGLDFEYKGRTSEIDDFFYQENVIVLTEYTVHKSAKIGTHLLKKKIIYDHINSNTIDFIKFLCGLPKFSKLKTLLDTEILSTYPINKIQVKIMYVSRHPIEDTHKNLVEGVLFLDYPVLKYFEGFSKVVQRTGRFEFYEFLRIPFSDTGLQVLSTSTASSDTFHGHILPEDHSKFREGYKVITFYIDAESLMRRAYVLRRDGWRNSDNIGLYQRMLIPSKIKSMRKYLHSEGRVFVNNIIVTLPINKVKLLDEVGTEIELDEKGNFKNSAARTKVSPAKIQIENGTNLMGIIDGQHRSYAYHEGDDPYETSIRVLRRAQNLLVTGILYPSSEPDEKRMKFEAKLFSEINANQARANNTLLQEIESITNPFSTVAISKVVLNNLNLSGPLKGLIEQQFFEKGKLKTSTIISYGLRPLLKMEGRDTLMALWTEVAHKKVLLSKNEDFDALIAYRNFCTAQIRELLVGFKEALPAGSWKIDRNDPNAIINVTTIIGLLVCLRLLIENNKTGDSQYYKKKLAGVSRTHIKGYKSSQYTKLGQDLYRRFF